LRPIRLRPRKKRPTKRISANIAVINKFLGSEEKREVFFQLNLLKERFGFEEAAPAARIYYRERKFNRALALAFEKERLRRARRWTARYITQIALRNLEGYKPPKK